MFRSPLTRITLLAGCLLATLVFGSWLPAARADCPGNVAVNSGFEEGFSTRGGGEVEVANSWTPWYQEGPGQEQGLNHRPEYDHEDGTRFGYQRIHGGNSAQKWGKVYATHHAGVYQQISVPAGSVVTLVAYAQAWSSTEDDPSYSKDGKYGLSVGIDPTGGTDFNSANIVWSDRNYTLDQWVELAVQAQAQAGTITVYLRGDAEWPVKHNDAYFDDVCVAVVAPTAAPTQTPRPTNTPEDTPVPSATLKPTTTPTLAATATPQATEAPAATATTESATLKVIAFEDRDGNGTRGEGEALLSGASIEVRSLQGELVASAMSSGSEAALALEPGEYDVTVTEPTGYVATSPGQSRVALGSGQTLEVSFGARFVPTPTSAATATVEATAASAATATSAAPSGSSAGSRQTTSIIGLVVALIALSLPFVLRFARSRLR